MEFCDPTLLRAMFPQPGKARESKPRMTRLAVAKAAPYCPPAAKQQIKKNCQCRKCPTCLENARWEAIFQQKFADPDYYRNKPMRSASSLHSVR